MTFIISYRISLGEGKVPRMAGDLQTAVSFAGGGGQQQPTCIWKEPKRLRTHQRTPLTKQKLAYKCGTVGTDMVRKKVSDSSRRQSSGSDNVVSSLCHHTGEFTSSSLTHLLEQSRSRQNQLHCCTVLISEAESAKGHNWPGFNKRIYTYMQMLF